MVRLATLTNLAALKAEMARSGRTEEESAIAEALQVLASPDRGFLGTTQAAERLGVSTPTVKRWIRRGTLSGGPIGRRWRVSSESVERVIRLRQALLALDKEGNPTQDEIARLSSETQHTEKAS